MDAFFEIDFHFSQSIHPVNPEHDFQRGFDAVEMT